ncbi:PTB domain-containing engulfment adapter protein 1-like isoform X1 [Colossoma macropomum]|uniref:PTB domain-containing engulfment adapter protein 1-like isoform X1 n=2 Tax=Colossoma macropomum TaxID=42526 RepID=UPI001864CD27|nr:PTB domain-containing engulfment adapter protein 1-like isoform X1 [Colossoma macropomum]
MSDIEDDTEISFSVKFLDRVEVVRPDGMEILMEAAAALQNPDRAVSEKVKKKKTKVHLFLSRSAIDILEHKTKFMLYTCSLSSVSFCAVHQTQPKLFGFIAKHPAVDTFHCYIFQSRKFSHLMVSVIGDAFRASRQSTNLRGSRDLVVEALRHKNNVLQRENTELKRKLQDKHGDDSDTEQTNSHVRFSSGGGFLRNT